MKFRRIMKNKLAVSAVTGAILMSLITLTLLGMTSYLFVSGGTKDFTTVNPEIGFLVAEDKSFTISSAPQNVDWADLEFRVDGTVTSHNMVGKVKAGDIIITPDNTCTVAIRHKPTNTLVISHRFPGGVPGDPPDKPCDPIAADSATGVDLNPALSVYVSDPDGDTMKVSFYDGLSVELIGIDYNVQSGTRATVTWSDLDYETTYSWYAVANDGEVTVQSDTWEFTTTEQFLFGDLSYFNDTGVSYVCTVTLDREHVAIAYADCGTSYTGTAIIGTISGDTITYGSAVVFNDAMTFNIAATVLDDNHFVITYQSSSRGTAIIGTWNGEDGEAANITFGNPVDFNNRRTLDMDVTALNNTHIVISYVDKDEPFTNAKYGTAIVGTWNGDGVVTSLTFGSPEVFEPTATASISSTMLDSTHIVIAYLCGPNMDYKAIVGAISSNLIVTFDISVVFGGGYHAPWISVDALDSNSFVIGYRNQVDAVHYGTAIVGIISASDISFGLPVNFEEEDEVRYTSVIAMDSTHVVIAYGKAIVGTILEGDSIVFESPGIYYGSWYTTSATALDRNHFVIAYGHYGVSGQAIVGEIL